MPRIVSVWLKTWPIARLLLGRDSAAQADAVDPFQPLVLVAPGKGGARLTALNRAARDAGLQTGDLMSNARSKVPHLQMLEADPAADAAALRRLALWALRYTPTVAPWDETSGADGLFLDITGCAHLIGGEDALLRDLAGRLRGFRLQPRLALAGTAGASWALARYGGTPCAIVPDGGEAEALRDLPVAALRLSDSTLSLMRRLGFKRIGAVMGEPRAPLAARFDGAFLLRLDQALGRAPEPLRSIVPPPVYRAQASFPEPIVSSDDVLTAASRLLHHLAPRLAQDDVGARVLRLLLFRVDGNVASLDVALAAPSRDPEHIARLIALRLERLQSGLDAGFGFEAAAVHVSMAEPLAPRQTALAAGEDEAVADGLNRLIDRLRQRLGPDAVRRIQPCQSHVPERAEALRDASSPSPRARAPSRRATPTLPQEFVGWVSASARNPTRPGMPVLGYGPSALTQPTALAPRPLLLLPTPEPAEVMALIPDGPPRRFRWRGVTHQVAGAEGPERIAPEWWRCAETAERDYYTVEDTDGRRFWLYRYGLYDRGGTPPQWFVHGVFG